MLLLIDLIKSHHQPKTHKKPHIRQRLNPTLNIVWL